VRYVEKNLNKLNDIYNKVRKHGIVNSSKILRFICWRHILRFICWKHIRFITVINPLFYYYLVKLILTPELGKKRILGVWDCKSLPWDVVDPLVFIEVLSILKIKHDAEEVDICIVYDRDKLLRERRNVLGNPTTSATYHEYSSAHLLLYSTCPYLGTVYQFYSRREFYRFLKMNNDRFYAFPQLSQHFGEAREHSDLTGSVWKMIQEFYDSCGYIPFLRVGKRDLSWARWFYFSHLPDGSVPIALSFNMISHNPVCNVDPGVWLSFVDRCKIEFPEISFVVVGIREDAFDGLENRKDIVFSGDYGTSLIEEFALVRASLLYMGTTSRISAIAVFSDIPYLVFEFPYMNKYGLEEGNRWPFATEGQKMFSTGIALTPELLFEEFKKIYLKLDQNSWHHEVLKEAHNKLNP